MGEPAHNQPGFKWLPGPLDINNVNATLSLSSIELPLYYSTTAAPVFKLECITTLRYAMRQK